MKAIIYDLVDRQTMILNLQTLKTGYIIIGGPHNEVYGTLPRMDTLFVWTTRKKAEDFICSEEPGKTYTILEEPIFQIGSKALRIGFSKIRFDYFGKNAHPKQEYLNLPIILLHNYIMS